MAGYSKSTRNTTGGLRPADTQTSALVADYWSKLLRESLYPYMVTRQFGREFILPEHTGDRVRLPNWGPVLAFNSTTHNWGLDGDLTSICATELGETATPGLVSTVEFGELTALIRSFEGARGYSQKSILISHVDILENLTEMMGKELAFRLDRYYFGGISGKNIKPAQGGKTGAVGKVAGPTNYLRAKDFIRFAAIMENAGVPTWDDGTYVMVINPLSKYDIFTDTSASGFLALTQYGDPTRAYRGEIGTLYGIRLVTSALQKRYFAAAGTSATYYLSVGTTGSHGTIYSPASFFTLVFQNNGLQYFHKRPGSSGISDPTNKLGSVGVKTWTGVMDSPAAEYRRITVTHAQSLNNL